MITADDLVWPKGPVDGTIFPDVSIDKIKADLTQLLANAYADPRVAATVDADRQDKLARALVLYLVFDAAAQRMTAEPTTVNNGAEAGSSTYSVQQIDLMQARADKYLAEFSTLIANAAPTRKPMAVRNVFTW